ncbi:MAG: precorrin-4 C(11)-methyltransferase [Thermodesulfovibrionales bacterium]
MDNAIFTHIKTWFFRYVDKFINMSDDDDLLSNLKLKAEHTLRVEENIVRLAEVIGLDEEQKNTARTIALFHDIGRFPQYLQYRTFRDAESVNHAVLSSEIVEGSGVLKELPILERQIIIESIKFHNALNEPDNLLQPLFLRLIRDADKLDIWRVFSECFRLPSEQRPRGAVLGLPDSEGVSEEVLKAIKEKRIAFLKDVRNQNDFRLLQLSWVFDLNFRESFKILKERDYFSVIGDIKNQSDMVEDAIRSVLTYIEKKLNAKVYFIGAGPGDPELLTVKGKKILDSADVIIYAGSLINPDILKGLKAELYDSAGMNLEEIIEIMRRAYHEAKVVARLHSGDVSIYSAINEQINRLKRLNIEFEVIPGVSSFQAGAAVLSQELTIPEISQTVILTRLEGRTPVPEKERLRDLARHNATMVIFLSAGLIERVQEELLQAYPKDTPFVVIEKATWPEQRIFRGRLRDLATAVKEAGIKRTALIYVGNTLGVSEEASGKESKLYNKDFKHGYRQ